MVNLMLCVEFSLGVLVGCLKVWFAWLIRSWEILPERIPVLFMLLQAPSACKHDPTCPSFQRRGIAVDRPMALVVSPCSRSQEAQKCRRPALRNRLAFLDLRASFRSPCMSSKILVDS